MSHLITPFENRLKMHSTSKTIWSSYLKKSYYYLVFVDFMLFFKIKYFLKNNIKFTSLSYNFCNFKLIRTLIVIIFFYIFIIVFLLIIF